MNLLSLMGDAGIQDISKKSTLSAVLMNVEEKFRLDLTGKDGYEKRDSSFLIFLKRAR